VADHGLIYIMADRSERADVHAHGFATGGDGFD
jgi:hypothetical protein